MADSIFGHGAKKALSRLELGETSREMPTARTISVLYNDILIF